MKPGTAFRKAGLILWGGLATSLTVQAQEVLSPWPGMVPGQEHPAAWALQEGTWAFGLQHAARWSGSAEPWEDQWFCAGWNPARRETAWSGSGLADWAFGTAHTSVAVGDGWRTSRHALHAATRVQLDRHWTGSAGIGIGARTWLLDGRTWSWDAQYGPAGYDPTAPSGEPDGIVGGAGVQPELSLGVGAEYRPGSVSAFRLRGAATLHHILATASPGFLPTAGDTVKRSASWWFECSDDLGGRRLEWRTWHRGAIQGPSHLVEFGSTIGRSFGTASRHTRNQLDHHLSIGVIWRSDGQFRLPLRWKHAELEAWVGPGVDIGHASPAAQGWAVGLGWTPDFSEATPIGSR